MSDNDIVKDLESLTNELHCEESECNEVIVALAENVIAYIEHGDEIFIKCEYEDEISYGYSDRQELVDDVKSLINELKSEYGSEEIINVFTNVLTVIG